jgi:hypothetical protein
MNKHLTAISFFFAASLALAGCGGTKGASSASSLASNTTSSTTSSTTSTTSTPTSDGATLAAAKTIAANATRDGATCDAASLLSACSYSGKETLTKTRAFNLLYQAYHASMPDMVGQRNYGAYLIAVPYTGVPSEAETAVKFLSDHGILVKETTAAGAVINEFNGDEDFTEGLGRYLERFHTYYGTSLHDDFGTTINHDFLYANPETVNKTSADFVDETNLISQSAINTWVSSHLDSMVSGTVKDNALAYKTSLYDETAKEANVCAGAYTSYEILTNPVDYSGLFSSCASLFQKQGFDPLFSKMDIEGEMTIMGHPFGTVDVPCQDQFASS